MNIFDSEKLESRLRHLKVPAATLAKIQAALDRSSAADAAASAAGDLLRETQAEFRDLEQDIRRKWGAVREGDEYIPAGLGRRDFDNNRWLANLDVLIEKRAEVRRREAAYKERQIEREGHAWLSEISAWAVEQTGRFTASASAKPALRKGEALTAALERVRDEIVAIEARIDDAASQPDSLDELLARADASVEDVAAKTAPSVYTRTGGASPVQLQNNGAIHTNVLFWALRDQIKQSLRALIRESHPGGGLSVFDRAAELAALEAEKLAAERQEEAIVEALAETGHFVARRRDANPLAILEVEASA